MSYALLPCPHPDICTEPDKEHEYDIFNDGKFEYENAYEIPLVIDFAQQHHISDVRELAEEIDKKYLQQAIAQ
jgi:hypothetical protein